jgi:hypothetical protein
VRTQWVKAIADTKKTLAVPAINAADERTDFGITFTPISCLLAFA